VDTLSLPACLTGPWNWRHDAPCPGIAESHHQDSGCGCGGRPEASSRWTRRIEPKYRWNSQSHHASWS